MNCNAICIIDDNPADIMLAAKVITKFRPDSIIESATDGREALRLMKVGKLPALIFLDYQMPGLSGVDVLHEIRKQAETHYLPVVMLTSSSRESDMKASYDAGANSYITKQYDIDAFNEEIIAVLHYWLDINKSPINAS